MGYREEYEKRTGEAAIREACIALRDRGGLLPIQLLYMQALEAGPEVLEAYHEAAAILGLPKFGVPTVTKGDGAVLIDLGGGE